LLSAIRHRTAKRNQTEEIDRVTRNIERLRRSVAALGDKADDLADKLLEAEEKLEALQKAIIDSEQAEGAKLRAAKRVLRGLKVK
jgi:septal ring factor EnvC (AmiA/AmiB activator)